MARMVDTREYLDMVCGLLAEGQTGVPVPVAGSSMTPFLHPGDMVYLDLPDRPLKKGDILLFTRPDGRYILHRLVKVNRDGSLIMLGDAQMEREWVAGPEWVHARVTGANHKGQQLTPQSRRWRIFATFWMWPWVIPLRRVIMCSVAKLKKITR